MQVQISIPKLSFILLIPILGVTSCTEIRSLSSKKKIKLPVTRQQATKNIICPTATDTYLPNPGNSPKVATPKAGTTDFTQEVDQHNRYGGHTDNSSMSRESSIPPMHTESMDLDSSQTVLSDSYKEQPKDSERKSSGSCFQPTSDPTKHPISSPIPESPDPTSHAATLDRSVAKPAVQPQTDNKDPAQLASGPTNCHANSNPIAESPDQTSHATALAGSAAKPAPQIRQQTDDRQFVQSESNLTSRDSNKDVTKKPNRNMVAKGWRGLSKKVKKMLRS